MPRYTNRQQLISTKTIAEIAKQVNQDMIDKLVKRDILFGTYNAITNEFISNQDNQRIFWDSPKIEELSDIPVIDNSTLTTATISDNTQTQLDEQAQAAAQGGNVIGVDESINGKRFAHSVLIHAVSALVRFDIKRIGSVNDSSTYADNITFKYGIYKYNKVDALGYMDADDLPTAEACIKWKPFGYSHTLDNEELSLSEANALGKAFATKNWAMEFGSGETKTLAKGQTTMRVPNDQKRCNIRTERIYKEFKRPIEISYRADSQTGEITLTDKILFAIQSDLPSTQGTMLEPRAIVCCKLYYTNKM